MRNLKSLPWMVLASMLVISPLAIAEVPVTVTLGGSQQMYDDDREVDDELFPYGAIEYRFNERWATEVFITGGEADADASFTDNVDIINWHLDALYYTTPDGNLHPYLAFGAGELERDWKDVDAKYVDTQLNAGGGFRYYLNDHWSWRADARWLHSLDESDNDLQVSIGISYGFAPPPSRKQPMVVAAAEPEPEPMDSDGDGVMDDVDECPDTPPNTRVDARGCAIIVPQVASIKLTVLFAFDSNKVDTRYFEDIEGLANFLNRFEELTVDIEGHTDSRGDDAYNMSLSQRRADAVREILIKQYGIAGDRLEAIGYGESRPVATNDTDAGRAKNRRVMGTLEVEYK